MLPASYRKHLWFKASGASAMINLPSNREQYGKLKEAGINYPSPSINQIEVDLRRTFSELEMETSDRNVDMLRNVLIAYTKRNPMVSYCQGMNFIVARLLKACSIQDEVQ